MTEVSHPNPEALPKPQQELYVQFLPGLGGTVQGGKGLEALKTLPFVKEVTLRSSIMTTDAPLQSQYDSADPNRRAERFDIYAQAALDTFDKDPNGRYVFLVNSGGGIELGEVLRRMRGKIQTLYDKGGADREQAIALAQRVKKDFDVVMMGAAGMEDGLRGVGHTIASVGRLAPSQLNFAGGILPNDIAGREAFRIKPVEGASDEQMKQLNADLSAIYPERDNIQKTPNLEATIDYTVNHEVDKIVNDVDRLRIDVIDMQIQSLIQKWKQSSSQTEKDAIKTELTSNLQNRAKIVAPYAVQAYNGEVTPEGKRESEEGKKRMKEFMTRIPGVEKIALGVLSLKEKMTFLRAAYKGEGLKQLKRYIDLGMSPTNITIAIPELDVFVTAEDILQLTPKLTKNGAEPRRIGLVGATHADWATENPSTQIVDLFRAIYENRTATN